MNTDPFLELLDHEIGKMQMLSRLMRTAPPDRVSRQHDSTYGVLLAGLAATKTEYTGKKFRKVIQEWSDVLYKDGCRKILSHRGEMGEGAALIDFSRSIINAFKKL